MKLPVAIITALAAFVAGVGLACVYQERKYQEDFLDQINY